MFMTSVICCFDFRSCAYLVQFFRLAFDLITIEYSVSHGACNAYKNASYVVCTKLTDLLFQMIVH